MHQSAFTPVFLAFWPIIYSFFWNSEISEDEAEERLQEAIQEKFSVFGDVCAIYETNGDSSFQILFHISFAKQKLLHDYTMVIRFKT
jgi:hypothetical protein